MDIHDIPVNKPDECTNHTTDDILASHSRDWSSSVQVQNGQLQCGGPKSYNEDKEILKHNDSSDSLVEAVAAKGPFDPFDPEAELCIGYSTTSKLSAAPVVQQHKLPDHVLSPVTECAMPVIPVNKEHFKLASSVPDSDEDHSVNDVEKPSVFVVYSEEDNPNNHILELSDMLNIFGYNCEVDQYYSSNPSIYCWGQWCEEMIKKISQQYNGSILYICSPTLCNACTMRNSSKVTMKYGHINNHSLNSLIVDPSVSLHVIPVFLEQYDEKYIPSCLLRTHAYALSFSSKVLKVFTPEKMIAVREKDMQIVNALLSTPGLESFRSFLYRLRGRGEAIKPTESVDIATLPSSLTSINNQQVQQLQGSSCRPLPTQTPPVDGIPSHVQHFRIQPHQSQTPHDGCSLCLQRKQQFSSQYQHADQQHTTIPSSDLQHTLSPHMIYTGVDWYSHDAILPVHAKVNRPSFLSAVKENVKQLVPARFCHINVLRHLFVLMLFVVSVIFLYFLYILYE